MGAASIAGTASVGAASAWPFPSVAWPLICGMAVDLWHDQVFAAWKRRQSASDCECLVAFFGRIDFEFEFFFSDQIVGDGGIVDDQAIRKIQVY